MHFSFTFSNGSLISHPLGQPDNRSLNTEAVDCFYDAVRTARLLPWTNLYNIILTRARHKEL